jgi:hypothetical protein
VPAARGIFTALCHCSAVTQTTNLETGLALLQGWSLGALGPTLGPKLSVARSQTFSWRQALLHHASVDANVLKREGELGADFSSIVLLRPRLGVPAHTTSIRKLPNSNFVSEMAAPSTVLMSYPHPTLNS